jgi:hypothetical protein
MGKLYIETLIKAYLVIHAKAGIQKKPGFPRIKYGAGFVKPGMTVFVLFLICLTTVSTLANERKFLSVQVKKTDIRSSPSFLGKILTGVSYGDQVEVRKEEGAWNMVSLTGTDIKGWIHTSALTSKRIVLRPGTSDVKQVATSDEVALAGKGFNKEVEREFRDRNPQIDLSMIDRMEKIVISQDQIKRFLTEGELSLEGSSR